MVRLNFKSLNEGCENYNKVEEWVRTKTNKVR